MPGEKKEKKKGKEKKITSCPVLLIFALYSESST